MSNREQLDELLLDRAVWGLSETEREELVQVMDDLGVHQIDGSFDVTAAAVTAALLEGDRQSAPAHLVGQLEADAICHFAHRQPIPLKAVAKLVDGAEDNAVDAPRAPGPRALPPAVPEPPAESSRGSLLPWLLAAAAIVVAFFVGRDQLAPVSTPTEQRQAMIDSGVAMVRYDWVPGPSELRGNPSGEVVWSDETQSGFMTFRGLPVNDSESTQYQLWIFDGARSLDKPVDGGVFDIPPGSDEVVVPIDAKILVHQAAAFAVTVEKPGGVVVSDREHIVTVANL